MTWIRDKLRRERAAPPPPPAIQIRIDVDADLGSLGPLAVEEVLERWHRLQGSTGGV